MSETSSIIERESPRIRRMIAPNPGPMTARGTNTYVIGENVLAIVDPGPDYAGHRAAILRTVGSSDVRAVLVTHAHVDHSAGARALAREIAAPILAFGDRDAGRSKLLRELAGATSALGGGEGVDGDFAPDQRLADGEHLEIGDLRVTASHTPGHLGDHLCFEIGDLGVLLTGDHVMGWSTSFISPPDGDMGAYMRSLEKLRRRRWRRFLPGHGDPIEAPDARLAELVAHRRARERQILETIEDTARDVAEIVDRVYLGLASSLKSAAARNVLAHLIDLCERDLVTAESETISAKSAFRARAAP